MAEVMDARGTSLETLAEHIDRAVQAITRLKAENAKLTARDGAGRRRAHP
jgi:plasmid maintenance system antidote protein VapI